MPVPTEPNASGPNGMDVVANQQDIHDIFRFSAKLQFAESICKIEPIPLDRVQLLLESCPIPSEETLKFDRVEYQHAVAMLLSFRSQESLLSLAHFYTCSKGQFENEIIPRIQAYLDVLKLLKFNDYLTLVNAERFAYHLVIQLSHLCWKVERGRSALLQPFLDFYQHILQHNNLPLIYGTLTAMGEVNFPLAREQVKLVSSGLDGVISNIIRPVEYKDISGEPKPMLIMVFKVMEQLTRSSMGIPPELCEQYYNIAHYFAVEYSTPPTEPLFVQIVVVMVRVGISEPHLAERVFGCLLEWISSSSPAKQYASELLYQAAIRGIAELAAVYPTKLNKIIDPLRDFVLYSTQGTENSRTRDEAITALCTVLRLEMSTHGVEIPRQLINSLFNLLHPAMHYPPTPTSPLALHASTSSASSSPPPTGDDLHRIVIILLGRITCALDDPKVTEIVMPNFMSRIGYPPADLDVLMLDQLTNIALLGQQNSTNEVVQLMLTLFKKIVKDPNHGVIVNTIPAALHNLAVGLTNVKLRQDLCRRTLKLFQQLAKGVRLTPNFLSSPVLKGMGFLLPTMSELTQLHLDPALILNPDPVTLKLFRNVWFYCVLFGYTTPGMWRSDWRDAAARLALDMPVIITSKSHIYLEMELELDNILKQGFEKDEFAKMKARLPNLPPYPLRSLTFPQCAYIHSVNTLETLRVRSPSPSFKAVFSYLEDQGIDNPNIQACLRSIADMVFTEFLNLMGNKPPSPAREADLAHHTQFLLVKFCHPVEAVRKASDQCLVSLVARFPQVLWNKQCVVTLLELLECVGAGAAAKPLDMISVTLPSSGYQIELPDDTDSRLRLLRGVERLCAEWLREGIKTARAETHAVLHDYIRDVSLPSTRAVLLIVDITSHSPSQEATDPSTPGGPAADARAGAKQVAAAATAAAATAKENIASVGDDCSLFVHSLELKARYSGEIRGMLKLLADVSADGKVDSEKMERFLLRDLKSHQVPNEGELAIPAPDIHAVLYRAAAYLVATGAPGSAELLYHICWLPARIFTPEALTVGVTVWEWLLAERADLGNRVMTGIGEAWAWSVDSRIGLFSRASRPPNPLSIVNKSGSGSSAKPATNSEEARAHVPHRIWLKFLEDRFNVVRHNNFTQLDIIIIMLHKAVADPHALSVQPSSLGARFQLLLLCLKFIHAGVCDPMSEALLRDRLYASGFTWFYYEAMWYSYDFQADAGVTDGRKELKADVKKLIDFCKAMASEKLFESESAFKGTGGGSVLVQESRTRAGSVAVNINDTGTSSTIYPPASYSASAVSLPVSSLTSTPSSISTGSMSIKVNTVDLIGMGLATHGPSSFTLASIPASMRSSDSGQGVPVMDEMKLRELRRRRNLLILLVGHEIERIAVWNNPLNRIPLQNERNDFKYEMLQKSLKSTWKDYITTAWFISSKLAVQLTNRFQQESRLKKYLQELILAEPTRALEIPDALQILVTEDTVRANIPELKMLLYWTAVTPPRALSLLGRSYQSHPLVTQYAIRVLRSLSAETNIFYLPQLVQTLRYDRTDLIEGYLIDAALRNELLAHQLLWNLQTYTEADPTDPNAKSPDDDFARKCSRLRDRVLANMDPRSLRHYREEFDFFSNFTALSGKLLKIDASQRRAALKDELRSLRVDSGLLYLPTNPNSVVIGIEVDSCITLQSAAKVPILVNFKVISRDAPTSLPASAHGTPNASMSALPLTLLTHSAQFPTAQPHASLGVSPSSAPPQRRMSRQLRPASEPASARIQGCIFKSGDDIRQDMLALQVIDLFKRIFQSVGLDLYLFPYKVIASKPGCGIIELVPNTMSRDQLGKKVDGSLFDYFIAKYGPKNSIGFQTARRNFIQSMAAYAIVSYILQLQDRHNGNILVDEEGHIVHIDFGFIFDISPGGDLVKIENSPFKLSQEMIDIMGGHPHAEQFMWFMELGVRAFLAVRQHMDAIITIVDLMLPTQLPCFKEVTITNLRSRFCPEKNETGAAKFGAKIMAEGFSRVSSFLTYFYDMFQYFDNGIEM